MALASGATFGPYRVIEQLGKGGMASVYKAYEAALDRYVALKVLPSEFLHEATFAERFQREAKVVAKLEHPNIIPIFNFGIEGGIPWMAMRLIPGGTLSSLLKQRSISPAEIVPIIQDVAAALEYAHGKGIMHRDVKPQNVLLDESGRVYLADFGIARMVEGSSGLTATGMISGTPQYMAPEQATGGTLDHRCDIYALGVVAYEMLTGHVPFTADTPIAVLLKHVSEPIPLPSTAEAPEPLVRPVLKCMSKRPEDRWGQATEFARALDQGLAEAMSHGLPPTTALPRATVPPPLPGSVLPGAGARPASAPTTRPPMAATASVRPAVRARHDHTASMTPLVAIAAIVALLGLGALGAGAWFLFAKDRPAFEPSPVAEGTTPKRRASEVTTPSTLAANTAGPVMQTLPTAPPPTATPETTLPRAKRPEPRGPVPPSSVAAQPAATTMPTVAVSAVTAPAAGPSLDVDLEVIQDPDGPWATSALFVVLKLDDQTVKELPLPCGSDLRGRERIHLADMPTGPRRLLIAVSNKRSMDSEATIQGRKDVILAPGPNRLGIEVRYLSPEDWTIRFR